MCRWIKRTRGERDGLSFWRTETFIEVCIPIFSSERKQVKESERSRTVDRTFSRIQMRRSLDRVGSRTGGRTEAEEGKFVSVT